MPGEREGTDQTTSFPFRTAPWRRLNNSQGGVALLGYDHVGNRLLAKVGDLGCKYDRFTDR